MSLTNCKLSSGPGHCVPSTIAESGFHDRGGAPKTIQKFWIQNDWFQTCSNQFQTLKLGVITILVPRIDLSNPGTDVYNSGHAVFTILGPCTHLLQLWYF